MERRFLVTCKRIPTLHYSGGRQNLFPVLLSCAATRDENVVRTASASVENAGVSGEVRSERNPTACRTVLSATGRTASVSPPQLWLCFACVDGFGRRANGAESDGVDKSYIFLLWPVTDRCERPVGNTTPMCKKHIHTNSKWIQK